MKKELQLNKCVTFVVKNQRVYKKISHFHNSWGNDSIDSYKHIEICQKDEWYLGAFKKFEESNNAKYRTAEFDDMEYSKLKILLGKK